MKINIVLSVLITFMVSAMAHAVTPAPDGGYGGLNTAEGQNALLGLTTGTANTAVGWSSLKSNTDGTFNTAVGAATLQSNLGNQSTGEGVNNTAIGAVALLFNTTGFDNTALGAAALLHNIDGSFNTATGVDALFSNAGGVGNTAMGASALENNTIGFDNTAVGHRALLSNTTGANNTANGYQALRNNTTGDFNTADGLEALLSNTTGRDNTANGYQALVNNTTGSSNIAVGVFSGSGVSTANNVIAIGAGGANINNSCFIGQIYSNIQPVNGIDPDYVTVTSSGRLGRSNLNGSSRRFKHDIKPLDKASEVIFALKPVSFRYNKEYDSAERPSFGLIAEEVAQVDSDLVGRNKKGEPEAVRYDQINAMVLNEFLKEHKRVQQLETTVSQQRRAFDATITELKQEMKDIVARSKEQDTKIQKISTKIDLNKAGPRTIAAN
jgi:Chaperone of endosialidase